METVLRDAQPVKGTMSSDTTRAGRSTTPKHQKATSRSPVRNSSRKIDSGAKGTSTERHYAGTQAARGERSQPNNYASQQAEMENCMLRGRNQSLASEVDNFSGALQAAQSSTSLLNINPKLILRHDFSKVSPQSM